MPVLEIDIRSRALEGNPLSDPATRTLPVVVPEDHDPSQPIPVVWWLAGYGGVGRSMLAYDLWQEGIEQRLARLRAEGRIGPIAVALPDAFTRLGGCQYLSSPAVGDYEAYLWEELPAALAERMAVGRQGVAGKSSGGYGALMAVMRDDRPFEAVACHSGDMGFELSVFPELPRLMDAVRDHGSVEALLEAHAAAENRKAGRWFGPLSVLASCAVYSPDLGRPGEIELPFEPETGRLREAVLERWRALDPVRMVERSAEARARLAALRLLFVDCGRSDEHALHWGARQLSAALTAHGVAHRHEEFAGGHRATSHRLDVSLPALYDALVSD